MTSEVSVPRKPDASGNVRRHRLFLAVTLLAATLCGLALAEAAVRLAGIRAEPIFPRINPDEPTTNVPDPVLGWRAKPGNYHYAGYTPEAAPITLTIWPDGSRATAPRRVPRDRQIVLIGDSFTQGWAVSDDETFAWKLQARRPEVEVVDLGTAGYNGVQSLLRLQEHIATRPRPPDVVVYGLNDDQERRNVAEAEWLGLLAMSPNREMIRLPYALLDGDGALVLHPPEAAPSFPLRERFAVVSLLESAFFKLVTRARPPQRRAVTERLLERMAHEVTARGGRFLVAFLWGPAEFEAHYAAFARSAHIGFVGCRLQGGEFGELVVPGEGHPNGAAHSQWADCLERAIAAPEHVGAREARPPS